MRWIKPVLMGHFEFTEWTPDEICDIRGLLRCEKTKIPERRARNTGP